MNSSISLNNIGVAVLQGIFCNIYSQNGSFYLLFLSRVHEEESTAAMLRI